MSNDNELMERVARERESHTTDDVLSRAKELKTLFSHVPRYPSLKRLYAKMDAVVRTASGQKVLDLGCGTGERSAQLLKCGASVEGIDISPVYIEQAEELAAELGVPPSRYCFQVMDAHRLQFDDNTFDLVIGEGILHHLDLFVSTDEIRRVLKPGGRALFLEPLAANPLLKIFRLLTPRARTVDEKPLSRKDLSWFDAHEGWDVQSEYCGILAAPTAVATSILLRPFPNNWFLSLADLLEQAISRWSWFKPFNQYVLFMVVKVEPSGGTQHETPA